MSSPYVKDAFHRYVVNGEIAAVNPQLTGTKAAVHYKFTVPPGGEVSIKLRLRKDQSNATQANAWAQILKTHLPRASLKPMSFTQILFLPPQTTTHAT